KDPDASDILYAEALAAPDTINTMPEKTLLAFAEHGRLGQPMAEDGGDAEQVIARFNKAGVDDAQLAEQLQREGAQSFDKSWNELLERIEKKSDELAPDRSRSAQR
ncbi:MAG: transaldolase, partial [Pseudomonadota bacterium]|nr:transaldolase [Pseudomonadota bacterium]